MTSNGHITRFLPGKTLRAIGLCGMLAFVLSVASPMDDDVQQDCLGGRTRQHAVRLLKVSHPGTKAPRFLRAAVVPAASILYRPATTRASIAIDDLQHRGAIPARQAGGRAPPVALS